MSRIVSKPEIPYGSRRYRQGCRQFESNLEAIIKKARRRGVPVMLGELVSNLKDQPPFISLPGPESAADCFQQAQSAEAMEDYQRARQLYEKAKDLDALRFRAPEEFNDVLKRLAQRYNLPLVPLKTIFAENSPNGLIGGTLITEHLHPNIDGYFLMADAFFKEILRKRLIDEAPAQRLKPSTWYRRNWGWTPLDSVYAALTVEHLKCGWPFRPPSEPNRFFFTYRPQSYEEEIVLRILQKGDLTLEQGHLELAAHFESRGEFDKAFREYRALTFIVPYLDLFYQPMIDLLVRQKAYDVALAVLFDALHYQDTAFVYKWIGQILLVTGETRRGLAFMEEAVRRDPNDPQTLYNACRGCYNIGDLSRGDQLLDRLKKLIPNAPEIADLQDLRNRKAAVDVH